MAGSGLPGRSSRTGCRGRRPWTSKRSSTPAASRTGSAFSLAEMTATRRPAARSRSTKSSVVGKAATPFVGDLEEEPRSCAGPGRRPSRDRVGIVRAALRQARSRARPGSRRRRPRAACRRRSAGSRPRRTAELGVAASRSAPGVQERVEELLPGREVDDRGLRSRRRPCRRRPRPVARAGTPRGCPRRPRSGRLVRRPSRPP